MSWYYGGYPTYVPVAQRRAKALKQMDKLRKKGESIQPVSIEGRTIARSFWGKGWCEHLESFSDYSNRLPRGRTYVRNGSVCHLSIGPGKLEAYVSGSELYTVSIRIDRLEDAMWEKIRNRCAGQVGSMLELLQGKLSNQVMTVVTDRQAGLFPNPDEIELNCSCPDWATMCKHVAAVLYGAGHRLDQQPELLFKLRGVDPQELIAAELTLPDAAADPKAIRDDQLSAIFGIELEGAAASTEKTTETPTRSKQKPKRAQSKKVNINEPPTSKSISRLRSQLKLSAAAFAQAIGVSAATVKRWEATAGPLRLQARPREALAALDKKPRRTPRRKK